MEIDFGLSNPFFKQHFTPVADYSTQLSAREYDAVLGAVPQRMLAFSSGRHCAKKALRLFDAEPPEILRGDHREPLWPIGFVGSISHSQGLAGAVVAHKREISSLGLDIEEIGRVQPGMWDMLFTASEQEYLRGHTLEEQQFLTTLFFSMKESYYKLQFPLTHWALWFTDVEIHGSAQGYRLRVLKQMPGSARLPAWIDLHFARADNQVLTLCLLASEPTG